MPDSNEFPRWQEIDKIPPRGLQVTLTAKPEECAAVAKRLGLLGVPALAAELTITHNADDVSYDVEGRLSAQVVQECVVTLTPLPAKIEEPVSGHFMPQEQLAAGGGAAEITDGLDEVSEPIVNGAIDLGELVVQHLALGLDPYPRQPGVEAVLPQEKAARDTQKPFSSLATLIQEKQKGDKK